MPTPAGTPKGGELGSPGTYLGNNRVLVRVIVEEARIAMIVPADDLLITPWFIITGEYETDLARFFLRERRRDSVFIDVGANFGYFTCLMARFCPDGQIVGIEADRRIYEILRDNIAINGFAARPVHAAAGATGEPMTLYRRTTRPANTSMVFMDEAFTTSMGEAPVEAFDVAGVRVDDVARDLDRPVDFLKIDVEGAEPLVIDGARATIAASPRLRIVMEWSPGQVQSAGFDVSAFVDTLAAIGLCPHRLADGRTQPITHATLKTLPYQAGVVFTRR